MKDRYNHLLSKITDRKTNVDKFIEVLHTQTTWLTSPASTKYHLNIEGGLFEHSIGVAETLLQMRAVLAPEISEELCDRWSVPRYREDRNARKAILFTRNQRR
ncbi:hypothetical protein METP3_02358 [Methanosarcinales archaeon]|nr:hypothetical protein METP3_02358 [Methanosarcinales archaeon]